MGFGAEDMRKSHSQRWCIVFHRPSCSPRLRWRPGCLASALTVRDRLDGPADLSDIRLSGSRFLRARRAQETALPLD